MSDTTANAELRAGWDLLDPWFLTLLPALGLLLWLRRVRRPAVLPVADLGLFTGLPRTLRERLRLAPQVLQVTALACLSLALARPVVRDVLPLRSEGVDILLLLDLSSSMNEVDMSRTVRLSRIDAAKEQALAFAAARDNDRVGLMSFALFADLRCPLTLDNEALAAFLRGLQTVPERSEENRTAIGVALASACTFLEESDVESRVVVLLTDGENNVAQIEPVVAAKQAKDLGIRVHTIGLGTGRAVFGTVMEPDFTELRQVAETTGGRFFRARSADDLAAVYEAIDQEEKVELEDPRYRTTDWFAWPLGLAGILLGLSLLLELGYVREVR